MPHPLCRYNGCTYAVRCTKDRKEYRAIGYISPAGVQFGGVWMNVANASPQLRKLLHKTI